MTTKRFFMWVLLVIALIMLAVFLSGGFAKASEPLYNTSESSILKLDMDTWGQMLGHTLRTGEMIGEGDLVYWKKEYPLGTAVPKHRIMPHDFSVTMIVVYPWSTVETGVFVTLRYVRDMGDGFRTTTLLYMHDIDYDMKPDKITRRSVRSKYQRIYTGPVSSGGINNDTYVFNSPLPLDMPEWNEWVDWLYSQYRKEGAFVKGGKV